LEGKILELPRLVRRQFFQKCNLITVEEFDTLVCHKDSVVAKRTGATTIHEDGSITVDTSLKHETAGKTTFKDYRVSKDAIFNFKFDIEHFRPLLGDPFIPVLTATQNALIEFGVKNPRPYTCRAYRNNKTTKWHRHYMLPNTPRDKFWVTIYYMHPNWDIKYGGDIRIGVTEELDLLKVPCYSNSMVAHDGYFGHGVDEITLGYEGNRDIFATHWISD
jgi:hypothetical protein